MTQYQYDGKNQLKKVTHPSGRIITYNRDAAGRVSGITSTRNGVTTAVVTGIQWYPFGPQKAITYQNWQTLTRGRDTAYRPTGLELENGYASYTSLIYETDSAGNLTDITDNLAPANSRIIGYDALDRVISDSFESTLFDYDANGNRTSVTSTTLAYYSGDSWEFPQAPQIVPDSNRQGELNGGGVLYDGAGNQRSMGGRAISLTYNAGNRLASVNTGRSLRLQYNGLGEPVRGELDMGYGGWMYSYYYFSPDGLPLGVVEQQFNQVDREWVYLEGEPIAQFANGYTAAGQPVTSQVTYLHPDYLGSPRWGTNSSSEPTVSWQSDAFGMHGGEGMEGSTVMPLRFPGQIATGQGAFFLNYYRTYDAALGRYVESDPIGLDGGLNTYGYVEQNPLSFIDPLGLDGCDPKKRDCLQEALNSYSLEKSVNRIVGFGAGSALFGGGLQALNKTAVKPRGGISGGGPSGPYTSYSRRYLGNGIGRTLGRASIGTVAKVAGILGAGAAAYTTHYDALMIYLQCLEEQSQ